MFVRRSPRCSSPPRRSCHVIPTIVVSKTLHRRPDKFTPVFRAIYAVAGLSRVRVSSAESQDQLETIITAPWSAATRCWITDESLQTEIYVWRPVRLSSSMSKSTARRGAVSARRVSSVQGSQGPFNEALLQGVRRGAAARRRDTSALVLTQPRVYSLHAVATRRRAAGESQRYSAAQSPQYETRAMRGTIQ